MIARIIYLQFLIPIGDYFRTIRLNEFILDWVAAIGVTIALNVWLPVSRTPQGVDRLTGTATTMLAILVGFSLAAVTILTTNDTANVQKMKEELTDRQLGGKPVSLFQFLHTLFTYSLIVQITALFVNIIVAAVDTSKLSAKVLNVIYCLDLFLFAHIIFLQLRNISSLYCVFWNPRPKT